MTDDRIMEIAASLAGFTPEELQPERDRLIAFARAIRLAALEESMQICEHLWTRAGDADECADAIHALADGDTK